MTKLDTTSGGVASVTSYKELAREMGEKQRSGAVLCFPNETDDRGQRVWDVIPPSVTPPPTHVMEYGKDLKDEVWEGMGIPPEIARAEGTGAFAGRRVPLDAFYSILQEIVYWLIEDVSQQIMQPLVEMNYGNVPFEIIPFGLILPSQNQSDSEKQNPQSPEALSSLQAATESNLQVNSYFNLISDDPPEGYTPKSTG